MVKPKITKKTQEEEVEELLSEIEGAKEAIKDDISEPNDNTPKDNTPKDNLQQENDSRRNELLKLAEDGELDKTVAYIKKASKKVIDKLYSEYERRRMQKANEFLTDLVLSKFSSILGGFDAIESPEELEKELKDDELLRRDVYILIEKISPYIPYLGLASGGLTTAKHVYSHKSKPVESSDKTSEDDVKTIEESTNNDE